MTLVEQSKGNASEKKSLYFKDPLRTHCFLTASRRVETTLTVLCSLRMRPVIGFAIARR